MGESIKSKNSEMANLVSKYKNLWYLIKVSFIIERYRLNKKQICKLQIRNVKKIERCIYNKER